jgi:hypothetical protein
LVEQRTENPCVGGSIPPHTTKTKKAFQTKELKGFLMIGRQYSLSFILTVSIDFYYSNINRLCEKE